MTAKRYSREHEWIRVDGDIATIGITAYAAEQLGDVVFVELPEVGRKVASGEAIAVVESVKAASDVYAPLTGEIVEANAELPANPAWVNAEPQGKAWLFKLRLAQRSELDALLDADAYAKLVTSA